MSFAGPAVHRGGGEESVWRLRCSCFVRMQTEGGLACRPFLPSVASWLFFFHALEWD